MLLTLSLALAAPSLRIDSRYLASGGPVVVELDDVDPLLAPELARSVRLRGPDGEIVRWSASLLARDQGATIELLPDAGAGVHVLERCVTYSEEGHLRAPGEPGQPACYAVERADIVPAAPPTLPTGVRFERGLDALYAEVPWDAGLRYSLEVKGVGRVGGQTVPMPEGQARVGLGAVPGVPAPERRVLPGANRLQARLVVSRGAHDVAGPWERLEPLLIIEELGLDDPTTTRRIPRWTKIAVSPPDTPVSELMSLCGSLGPSGDAVVYEDVHDVRFWDLQGGRAHWTAARGGQVLLDGEVLDGIAGPVSSVLATATATHLLAGRTLVTVQDGAITTAPLPPAITGGTPWLQLVSGSPSVRVALGDQVLSEPFRDTQEAPPARATVGTAGELVTRGGEVAVKDTGGQTVWQAFPPNRWVADGELKVAVTVGSTLRIQGYACTGEGLGVPEVLR